MFSDIKGYSCSPMHMRPRCFEAIWNASIDKLVSQEACSRDGLHCTLHPNLVAKTKGTRVAACDAKDALKRRFQAQFQERIGVRCFFPEPIHGGNSNTGNIALLHNVLGTRVPSPWVPFLGFGSPFINFRLRTQIIALRSPYNCRPLKVFSKPMPGQEN